MLTSRAPWQGRRCREELHAELSIPQGTLPALRAASHPSLQQICFKGTLRE